MAIRINVCDIDDLLINALPEFAETVREHRALYGEEPSHFVLMNILFEEVQKRASEDQSMDFAIRSFQLLDRILKSGEADARYPVLVEIIEPLAHRPYKSGHLLDKIERVLGPVALAELKKIRSAS
jgi:hypothetical protein